MSNNLYSPHPMMINSGTFWRCRHGGTGWKPCWKCGVLHPIKFLKHIWNDLK